MNYQKLLQQIIGLSLMVLFLAGCRAAQAEPEAAATPVPPTVTPSPVPPAPEPTLELQEPEAEAAMPVPPTATPSPVPPAPEPTLEPQEPEAEGLPEAESGASPAGTEAPEAAGESATIVLSDGDELVLVASRDADDSSLFGFGVEGQTISSPGPTIKMRRGETVTITFENAHYLGKDSENYGLPRDFLGQGGQDYGVPHNFAVVADKEVFWSRMRPLWGAHVGGSGDPNLYLGERGSVTFTAEEAGSFFYVSAYADNVARGMWGHFIVEE